MRFREKHFQRLCRKNNEHCNVQSLQVSACPRMFFSLAVARRERTTQAEMQKVCDMKSAGFGNDIRNPSNLESKSVGLGDCIQRLGLPSTLICLLPCTLRRKIFHSCRGKFHSSMNLLNQHMQTAQCQKNTLRRQFPPSPFLIFKRAHSKEILRPTASFATSNVTPHETCHQVRAAEPAQSVATDISGSLCQPSPSAWSRQIDLPHWLLPPPRH